MDRKKAEEDHAKELEAQKQHPKVNHPVSKILKQKRKRN